MKIAVIIPSFYPATVYGGTIFSSLNTCKELVKKGDDVFVSTTNTNMNSRLDVPVNKWIELEGINVKYYNETIIDKLSIPLILNLWKDIRKADIVHVQAIFNTPVPAALFYAWLFRKPVLLSPRGVMGDWIINQGNQFKKKWLNFLIKPFSSYVTWHATAAQEADEIRNRFPDAKIVVIPNGIEIGLFNKKSHLSKAEYLFKFTGRNIDTDCKIVVSMGRLHKKKGFDILIESVADVIKTEKLILLIAGQDEGEEQKLKEKIAALNLQDYIFLIGPVEGEDKVDFFIHADLFALTSHNENFGNVYAEALASGIPVIASIYTPWEQVVQANCGRWVSLEKKQIAGSIQELLKEDKQQISMRCRTFIERFSWTETANKLHNQFAEMI